MENFYLPFVFLKLLSTFATVFRKRNTRHIKKAFCFVSSVIEIWRFYEYEEIRVEMLTFRRELDFISYIQGYAKYLITAGNS